MTSIESKLTRFPEVGLIDESAAVAAELHATGFSASFFLVLQYLFSHLNWIVECYNWPNNNFFVDAPCARFNPFVYVQMQGFIE